MTDANAAQAEYWDGVTAGWLAAERHFDLVATVFGDLAMDRLALSPGQRVLDIGCGSGATTLEIARHLGRNGSAMGVDIAPGMIESARTRVDDPDLSVTFAVADAQTDDLDGSFDRVFSRFGVMFFADPVVAFGNIGTAVAPGGRLAFVCWQDLVRNEWMFVPGAAAIGVTGEFPPMPGPGEPGPFSMTDPVAVTTMLTAAGWQDVVVEPVEHTIDLPEDEVASIVAMARSIGPVRMALQTADDETSAAIIEAVVAALRDMVVDGRLRLHAAVNLVTATWPG